MLQFRSPTLLCCRRFATSSILHEEPRQLWRVDTRNPFLEIPEAWVTDLSDIGRTNKSIVQLHPDIFRVSPRLDLLHRNVTWQQNYRNIQLTKMLSRAEMPGGGAKPWPQKKTGRAHVGSIRSPQFIRGGFAHGVRGPKTWFYMLPETIRIGGLCVALTIKHAQDDLVVVDDFSSLSTSDPEFLVDLSEARNWGHSVLFVDTSADHIEPNLVKATDKIPKFNVIPLYGLNCFSIVKHDTLVFSRRALDVLEERLLHQMHKTGPKNTKYRYMDLKRNIMAEAEENDNEDPIYPPSV
ncbi:ribosomal protein l4/L1 family domain-containing protein [Ditylenchus destructor]|nr:ribosomal protein l4/L1 family domain-containing protein [Ditylenchus destructor]